MSTIKTESITHDKTTVELKVTGMFCSPERNHYGELSFDTLTFNIREEDTCYIVLHGVNFEKLVRDLCAICGIERVSEVVEQTRAYYQKLNSVKIS